MSKKNCLILVCIILICLTAGFFLGYFLKAPIQIFSSQAIRENTNEFKFIHPLLAVGRPNIEIPSPEYVSLDDSVKQFISDRTSSGDINSASVYFINYGKKSGSFALNESEPYSPASLLKVVIMVAYFKEYDSDSNIFKKEFIFAPNVEQTLESVPFETKSSMIVGNSYDVKSLISKMIIDSDNSAMGVLLANMDNNFLNTVFTNLGLQAPQTNSNYTISAKDYSLFFRVLFNGSYLSPESSEQALALLSQSTFADGLVAGVPIGTTVSHKFGEHVNGTGDHVDSVELHDCGLVYPSDGPYLLCVMTKGKNLDSLQTTIGAISKMVYDSATSK